MKTLAIILFLCSFAYSQEAPKSPDEVKEDAPKCQHKDEDEFYDSLRHSPPMVRPPSHAPLNLKLSIYIYLST
jgi:hypothetical protein